MRDSIQETWIRCDKVISIKEIASRKLLTDVQQRTKYLVSYYLLRNSIIYSAGFYSRLAARYSLHKSLINERKRCSVSWNRLASSTRINWSDEHEESRTTNGKKKSQKPSKRSFIQAIGSLVLLYFQWVVNSFVDIFSDPWIIWRRESQCTYAASHKY